MQWVEYKRRWKVVDLKTFGRFMEDLVDKALEVTFERIEIVPSKRRDKLKAKVFTHLLEEDREAVGSKSSQIKTQLPSAQLFASKSNSCSICEEPGHFGRDCQEFRNTSVERRWMMVNHLGLCALCIFNHGKWPCRSKVRCDFEGCNELHHPLLHLPSNTKAVRTNVRCNSHCSQNKTVLFRIIPVTLYNEEKRYDTLALVDEGSSTSLIDGKIAEYLKLNGPREPFEMRWTNGVSRTEGHSRSVEMKITGKDRTSVDLCVARTVQRLDLPAQRLDSTQLTKEFQHLEHIEIPSYKLDTPKLLIGIDNMHLIAPLTSRVGEKGQPIAVECKLGWTVYGPRPNMIADVHFLGHHRCLCEECSKEDCELNQLLRESYQLEAVGVSPVRFESKEDHLARETLTSKTKRVGDRFEVGLL
ncbi:uncharacterized protein LOC134209676 [Armigeres subalbatus]|uniref:uncharacterized protein LOC134209676 n=1 Tax=Armigeres subalbatus TaxID=124917 RepID=UPI002ED05C34